MRSFFRKEWILPIVWLIAIALQVFHQPLLVGADNPTQILSMFLLLFTAIMFAAFAVVRHADVLAETLGEPLGTLILTLSVITIEVAIISAVMLTGDDTPTMARDTMYSIIMIVMNGLVGFTLLFGGLKHKEQAYNLLGTNTFLAIILPLCIISLVLPNYTHATDLPSFSIGQSIIIGVSTLALYGVFLAVQTSRHKSYFDQPGLVEEPISESLDQPVLQSAQRTTVWRHSLLLLAYLIPVVMLAKSIAVPVEAGLRLYGWPTTLGGFVIAALVLSPEAVAALKSALRNQLQRSINLYLGSVTATIGLTVPAVLCISVITGEPLLLGLEAENVVLLALTLAVSMVTYSQGKTNILLGAVHLVLFATFIMLIFDDM